MTISLNLMHADVSVYKVGDRVRITQECMDRHDLLPFAVVKQDENNETLYFGAIHSTTNEEWKIHITDTDYISECFS